MAGGTRRIRDLRKEHEAAEAREADGLTVGDKPEKAEKKKKVAKDPAEKKKKAPAKAKRSKTKALVRKRMLWGVFSNSMKEEGRFPYADREAADARAADLTAKHKKAYFVQAIKEPLVAAPEKEPPLKMAK
jgi:hypothetical protein